MNNVTVRQLKSIILQVVFFPGTTDDKRQLYRSDVSPRGGFGPPPFVDPPPGKPFFGGARNRVFEDLEKWKSGFFGLKK